MPQTLLSERVVAGDMRAVARAISIVENDEPGAPALLAQLRPQSGRAFLIGITGPAGTGKSTLVDQLVTEYRKTSPMVAVLAVDPSSPFTGGALLGDRVRMQSHASDAGVFIRSMATRGHVGGLAGAAADAAVVLDAAGFDPILIETVGVGQDEVEIARMADATVVLAVPGAGDDVQALKAGLMEIADVFVVNKADREGADRVAAGIEATLSLSERPLATWRPPVVSTVATTGVGIAELVEAIARFREATLEGRGARRRGRDEGRLRPRLGEIDHVGIAVGSLKESRAWWQADLAMPAGAAEEVTGQQVRVQFVGAGPVRLELIEPTDETSPVAKFLRTRGPGLHHVAVRVDDLDARLAELLARGVRLIDQVGRPGAHGTRVAFVHPSASGGVLVELVEHPREPRAPR